MIRERLLIAAIMKVITGGNVSHGCSTTVKVWNETLQEVLLQETCQLQGGNKSALYQANPSLIASL